MSGDVPADDDDTVTGQSRANIHFCVPPDAIIMPSVYLTTPGTRASIVSERLRVESPDPETGELTTRDVPLHDIEQVLVAECCSLTIPSLADFARREIPVILTTRSQRVLALCLPPAPHRAVRQAQYRRSLDEPFLLALAIPCVEAKIRNQRRVLQRLGSNRPGHEGLAETLKSLESLANSAVRASSRDTLRGYEGAAAGSYFERYGEFFPEDCPFERRSRRPPLNPPNAILSYAYTLLGAEAEAFLHGIGLDPALGFFHEPADRRPSLALDLIEPFRAPLADAMALDLIGHGTLKPGRDFERAEGGIYLSSEGRRRFHVAYERRMEREFTSEQHGRRTCLRAELHGQCHGAKKAFLDEEPYEPFVMN